MGLSFKKELTLADEQVTMSGIFQTLILFLGGFQIHPATAKTEGGEKSGVTRLQERLMKKLGTSSVPFTLIFPR